MRFPLDVRGLLAALLASAAIACSSSDDDGDNDPGAERPEAELNIVRLAADAPPLFSDSISFWAFRGEGAEARLYFQDETGGQGDEYLSLKLANESLRLYPDGTPFADGDSVLIIIKVVDPQAILFELQPAGLKFSANDRAELRIRYDRADGDFNDDGEHDGHDDDIEDIIGIWRQESPGLPFVRLGTARVREQKELRAELDGFSRYAIAY